MGKNIKVALSRKFAELCKFCTVGVVISEIGLRDRKKAATRAALSGAAARLARALGIECVTADAIASEAGVSTRTFHNYFSSKEEAVLAHFEQSVHDWVDLLRARPEDEPIWDSLEHVVVQIVTDPAKPLEETAVMMELVETSPALLAKKLEVHLRVTRLVGEVIAERLRDSNVGRRRRRRSLLSMAQSRKSRNACRRCGLFSACQRSISA